MQCIWSLSIALDSASAPQSITEATSSFIPTIVGHRPTAQTGNPIRHSVSRSMRRSARITSPVINSLSAPSLYVLNATTLSEPHAIDYLAADLDSYHVDATVITETHFKSKHSDSVVGVSGYTVFRRDRAQRRREGVALYVLSTIQSSVWTSGLTQLTTKHMNLSGFASATTHIKINLLRIRCLNESHLFPLHFSLSSSMVFCLR